MRQRWFGFVLVPLALLLPPETAGAGQDKEGAPLLGFAPAGRERQQRAEAGALAIPNPSQARAWLARMTREPHVAGTAADHETALFVRDRLREWGWHAELAPYEVLLNYPLQIRAKTPGREILNPRLELVLPNHSSLPVMEDRVDEDKDSANPAAFPAFHGYGVSGDVTGEVVYVNYGRPEDFAVLEKMGVEVEGKIVLARYGEIFRGLKVRNAQQRGAKGILIYSDPAEDGFARGDVYPRGPFRPGSAIQRGSVQFLSLGPGDPSTPGVASLKEAKRLPFDHSLGLAAGVGVTAGHDAQEGADSAGESERSEEKARREAPFATIPSLPISSNAARPILEALGGPNVPAGWQGGLPFAYHVGPGAATVHFSIQMDYKVRTVWNVIATIKGGDEPDRWVMIGNHRDAWVFGAVDPGSGTATTLETCRALGAAVRRGWKPRRTLVYASWDAEEYGLVGSTEWAEDHAREIGKKAMLMLNVDSAVAGNELDVDGIPSLRDLLLEAAGAIVDPRTGVDLRRTWVDKRRAQWAGQAPLLLPDPLWGESAEGTATRPRFSPQLDPLGSGSDYTTFVDHLGIPAIDVGFSGHYGVYHSTYDDFHWMRRHGDPEFLTHATAARLYTLIAMRAAAAEILPLTFVPYGEALREMVDDLRRIVERKQAGVRPGDGKPSLNFDGLPRLIAAVRAFQARVEALDRATRELSARDKVPQATLARTNDAIGRVERAFLHEGGLPGRPWFKHAIYAPGLTTGYASWPLPGLRQAILDNDQGMLAEQLPALVARLQAASAALKAAEDEAKRPDDQAENRPEN